MLKKVCPAGILERITLSFKGEMSRMKYIVKVVSRSIIMDLIAKIQNFFGWNLVTYENMITKVIKEVEDEGHNWSWYRIEISQLTNGAVAIIIYGE